MRILLLEDEPEMASALKAALERRQVIVDHVATLADAEAVAELWPYDVVVLDRRVPDGEGLDLIPKLRGLGVGAPVLMLTALGSINDRVAGLDAGADDYLSKPFAVEELMARLRALARRPVSLKAEQTKVGRLIYDFHHREAAVDDKPLDLLRRERLALEALMRRPGRTVLRATLEESVYAMEDEIESNALDSHLSRLRRKLDDVGAGVEIRAIRNLGYLLRATT
ncbi:MULTISPECIES: response regulator transcription factor [Sinorhizobium/Ensifer group]|uniref:response regulator transcription factor n=1 Tax=Sinorhizobium/Ensifer group TaxID=227292 RepID=UPI00070C3223|nr:MULTISPECIES: response regulator transcription factor [Sinorhizobium/Ensifer group]KRD63729.1 two-component system response regulator [Ensifer sp. Root278]MBV7517723.1 response regulator transcription factor [Ensifer sp. ENS12]SDA74475.1 DNA-binding response regulator, OmpR family, contains REC and winged-helix (wHTH) domain [Sinorhizobium sp. NFACC03]